VWGVGSGSTPSLWRVTVSYVCYLCVTEVLQGCYRGITGILQGYYRGITGVTRVLEWCGVSGRRRRLHFDRGYFPVRVT
jgi:hypothetical protein